MRRPSPPPHAQRGASYLEFFVAAAILGVLAAFLMQAVLRTEELAEKTAMEMTIRNLRSGLREQIADRLLHGRAATIGELAGANPVSWLERPPPGYVGERAAHDGDPPPGSWRFDPQTRELAYVPNLDSHFSAEGGGREIRWQARASKDFVTGAVEAPAEGVSLVQTTRYRWF